MWFEFHEQNFMKPRLLLRGKWLGLISNLFYCDLIVWVTLQDDWWIFYSVTESEHATKKNTCNKPPSSNSVSQCFIMIKKSWNWSTQPLSGSLFFYVWWNIFVFLFVLSLNFWSMVCTQDLHCCTFILWGINFVILILLWNCVEQILLLMYLSKFLIFLI